MPQAGIRFGIDGEALRLPLSGVGQYAFNLCTALERELADARFFAYGRLASDRLALPSPRWRVRQEALPALRRLPSFAWLKIRASRLCLEDRLDVFFAARTIHPRLPRPVRTLCLVHDLNHLLVPTTMPRHSRLMQRLWFARDVRRADHVLANSAGTARRLAALLGVRASDVLRPGLAPRFRPLAEEERAAAAGALAARGIRAPYLLWVGTLEPRKNVAALLAAFLSLQRRGLLAHHQLVLAGPPGWGSRRLRHALRRARQDGIVLAGYVPDALLPALYAQADVLVCPSLYEGFGMPVLEARACGTRLVVADLPELIEAGGPAAIPVRPTAEAIAEGIVAALASDRVAEDELALRFSWNAPARRMAALVRTAAGR